MGLRYEAGAHETCIMIRESATDTRRNMKGAVESEAGANGRGRLLRQVLLEDVCQWFRLSPAGLDIVANVYAVVYA